MILVVFLITRLKLIVSSSLLFRGTLKMFLDCNSLVTLVSLIPNNTPVVYYSRQLRNHNTTTANKIEATNSNKQQRMKQNQNVVKDKYISVTDIICNIYN